PDHDDPAYATPDRINAFGFLRHDPDGLRCPISSHVRRANPRDARGGTADESEQVVSRHRILRRGRSYGPRLPLDAAIAGRDDGAAAARRRARPPPSLPPPPPPPPVWLPTPHPAPPPRASPAPRGAPTPPAATTTAPSHTPPPAEPVRLRLTNVPTVVTHRGG